MVSEGDPLIRVGFLAGFVDNSWLGGISYYRNLLKAIAFLPDRKIEPVLFVGEKAPPEIFKGFPPVETVRTALLDRKTPTWMVRKGWQILTRHDQILERLRIRHRIVVLSHSGFLGARARIRTLGWIPDFQHKHMPEFFSPKEIEARDLRFRKTCELCTRVLVSSHAAGRDLERFYPEWAHKCAVLQFVVFPDLPANPPSRRKLEIRYGFSGPYFHLPNQFWAHKNHKVVIDALRILKEAGRNVLVLATGNTNDVRQHGFFRTLMADVEKYHLLDSFRVLGIVPYEDLISLMRYSVAVINPSFFEGWSTTVEEAKSLDKLTILSDIPVHREQSPSMGIYFDPHDFSLFANILWNVWKEKYQSESSVLIDISNIKNRSLNFAYNYTNIVDYVMFST